MGYEFMFYVVETGDAMRGPQQQHDDVCVVGVLMVTVTV
jgi:hypothetical protein